MTYIEGARFGVHELAAGQRPLRERGIATRRAMMERAALGDATQRDLADAAGISVSRAVGHVARLLRTGHLVIVRPLERHGPHTLPTVYRAAPAA
jgi:hypothetical protein